jgi:hypothetical protein
MRAGLVRLMRLCTGRYYDTQGGRSASICMPAVHQGNPPGRHMESGSSTARPDRHGRSHHKCDPPHIEVRPMPLSLICSPL